jgi:uncharacterized repeat protein (TIGR01451 family)
VECHDANGGSITITTYAIAPDETVTCTFDVALSGNAQIVRDVANVVVVDNDGQSGGDDDDEATPILDVPPAVQIVKSANPTQIDSGGSVTYRFVITNTSAHEQLTLLSLVDDTFGNIFAECVANGMDTTLDVGQSTTCEITRVLQQLPGSTHVNVATVTGGDDEVLGGLADPVSDSDDASVLTRTAIRIDALAPECVANAPYIQYDITPLGFTPSGTAKLTFYDLDGNLVESVTVTQLSGRVLFPGAEVDAEGNAVDWPGWKFENGLWVADPSDARLRDGLKVVVEVNPTAQGTVAYPPVDSPCADPEQVSADLAIIKSASQPQVGAGGGFTWQLAVINNGPDAATNVVVNDIVPSQFTVTGVTSSQFVCNHSGNTVSCTKPSLAVGESGQIAIAVTVPATAASGSVTNVGTVTASTPDPNTANNSDDASVSLVAQQQPVPVPEPPPVALPPTGANSTRPVAIAALGMVLFGGIATLIGRRRRHSTPVG